MNQGDVIKTGINNYKINLNVSFLMRFVLDYASSVDKAIDILRVIELHNDFDFNIHFMISDASGKSVVVEYIFDKDKDISKMVVTESTIITNFDISSDIKSGSGKKQYDIIKKTIKSTRKMKVKDVKNTLKKVKNNTQCSIIYDLNNREAIYYVRENYQKGYKVQFDENFDDSFPPNPNDDKDFRVVDLHVTKDIQNIEDTIFRVFEYEGDYGFNEFMERGGAPSELELYSFINSHLGINISYTSVDDDVKVDACSAFTVQNENGDGYFFGRNYDWPNGSALAVITRPKNGYASISTVDTSVISNYGEVQDIDSVLTPQQNITINYEIPDEILKEIVIYTPFDGMNEMGLSISLNRVSDGSEVCMVDQYEDGKVHLTITTVIRYLLDTAATVDEAVEKIKNINMHNHFSHFLISDASGKTVLVEYKNDHKEGIKIYEIETPLATNYYLADDDELREKRFDFINNDRRYDIILDRLTKKPKQNIKDVRNTLRASNQSITVWSAVFDKANLEATYFINNNFSVGYRIKLFDE